jgi:phospho-N-acetylmuramoyl-pentapeptide-transferase
MFYYLFYPLREFWFAFNVFRYVTFRAAMAGVTAFVVSVVFGPAIIRWLKAVNFSQSIRREYVEPLYELHKHKQGTPTMGGIIIILAISVATVLWADILNKYVMLSLLVTVLLGFLGFTDDYIKISKKRNLGLRTMRKLSWQVALSLAVAAFIYFLTPIPHTLSVPFFKKLVLDMGILYISFIVLVMVSSTNAVNLTDGLDGLAIGCAIIAALAYAIMSYVSGHAKFSEYLDIYHLIGGSELTVFCAAIVGAGLGFLWFNSPPANVFMGDTGSLALGGAIGIVAVLIKKELLLFLVGGVFVFEAFSVCLQIISVRFFKKKLFLVAPIHHHFQYLGWAEEKITIRLWIVAIILALLSLSTLKLQ